MWKKILLGIGLFVVLLLGVIAMQPATYVVSRSQSITAPAGDVFALVNNFRQWEKWSPWEKLDLNMKKTFEGSEEGAGSVYSWAGNQDVGKGRMTITESIPGQQVGIRLEFLEPFASTATTVIRFTGEGSGTKVEWTMTGENNFLSKAFGLFMNMDKMIGSDFEKGLAAMKQVAEKR
jgi:hypothetical protein